MAEGVRRLPADVTVGVPASDVLQDPLGPVLRPPGQRRTQPAHPRVGHEMVAHGLHQVLVEEASHHAGQQDDALEGRRIVRVGADQCADLIGHREPVPLEGLVLVGDLLRAALGIELVGGHELVMEGLLPGLEPELQRRESVGERPA